VNVLGYTDRVIISAFDHRLLKQVKMLDASIKVGALTMPSNFSNTATFKLLCKYLPDGKPLLGITAGDLSAIPPDALGRNTVDISGPSPAFVVAELANQIGAVYPDCTLSQVADFLSAQNNLPQYLAGLDFKVDFLHCHYSTLFCMPELISQLSGMGIRCSPWTPDRPAELELLAGKGCYSIITNRPDLLKNFI